jgi:cytochrome b involved in lipid metabolism
MDFEMMLLWFVVAAGLIMGIGILRSKRGAYKAHVQQFQVRKEKRQLTIGEWTREEVAKHKSADDLWLIIRDQKTGVEKVYDLTDYVEEHPGGMAIMYNAGGDATKGFHGPQHPDTVHELVKEYYIGTIKD